VYETKKREKKNGGGKALTGWLRSKTNSNTGHHYQGKDRKEERGPRGQAAEKGKKQEGSERRGRDILVHVSTEEKVSRKDGMERADEKGGVTGSREV